jgi:hypothetical protein
MQNVTREDIKNPNPDWLIEYEKYARERKTLPKKLENISDAIEILKTKFTEEQLHDYYEIIEKKMHIQRIARMANSSDVPQEQNTVKKLTEEYKTRIAYVESDLERPMTRKFTQPEEGILREVLRSRFDSLHSIRDYLDVLYELEDLKKKLTREGGSKSRRNKNTSSHRSLKRRPRRRSLKRRHHSYKRRSRSHLKR